MDNKDIVIQDLRRELEAAKHDLYFSQRCRTCKNLNTKLCDTCKNKNIYFFKSNYEWRGVCPANTPSMRERK